MRRKRHERVVVGVGWSVVAGLLIVCAWSIAQPTAARCERAAKGNSRYVGALRCKGCHQKAYKTWASSAHARAFTRLEKKYQKDAFCTKCHTLGTSQHLQGVQCESCHGPGKHYSIPEVMVDPELARAVGLKVVKGMKGCISCHATTPKVRRFVYSSKWKKITHGAL